MTNKSEPTTVSEKSSRLLKKMHGNCYIGTKQKHTKS
jgi:hypothetical protein